MVSKIEPMKTFFKKLISEILKLESRLVLLKYKPKVIAITGSVGKTTTKDAVFAVLSKVDYVRKSDKSYNSELGLPLTILGLPNGWSNPITWLKNIVKGFLLIVLPHKYPKWLVLEVGVGKPGDMKKTANFLKSNAVIITGIGDTPAHIEFFDSREHLIEEKAGLIKTLRKDGVLILNADDEAVLNLKDKTRTRVATYGFEKGADLQGGEENIFYDEEGLPKGVTFKVEEGGSSLPVFIEGVFGRNHMYAALAALTLASNLKLNLLEAINALKNHDIPPGRMRLLKGINDTLIIDDTYNSSPFASEAALETLGAVECGGRRIAVLGDMLELGKHTIDAHTAIGKVARKNADILVVVGPRAKFIKEGAIASKMAKKNIFEFSNSREVGDFLEAFLGKRDLVLIKGSQGMRMERVTASLLQDKENKHKLLVRQDKEWIDKE